MSRILFDFFDEATVGADNTIVVTAPGASLAAMLLAPPATSALAATYPGALMLDVEAPPAGAMTTTAPAALLTVTAGG